MERVITRALSLISDYAEPQGNRTLALDSVPMPSMVLRAFVARAAGHRLNNGGKNPVRLGRTNAHELSFSATHV
jgi:hypothetical protein